MNKKRPLGFTLLSIAIWWLAIAGFVGVFTLPIGLPMRVVSAAYGITALVAGLGLWRQASWAPVAFAIWSCAALVTGVITDVQLNLGPSLKGVAFSTIAAGLLWLVYRYICKRNALTTSSS